MNKHYIVISPLFDKALALDVTGYCGGGFPVGCLSLDPKADQPPTNG
jgi:hypothetical protein